MSRTSMVEETRTYLMINEAAELLGVTPATLRNWDRSGKLKARRHPLNGYRLYSRDELARLLEGVAVPHVSEPSAGVPVGLEVCGPWDGAPVEHVRGAGRNPWPTRGSPRREQGNGEAGLPVQEGALILVVDRDPFVRTLAHHFLGEAGFRVEFAEDGAQAVELARRLRPRLVIAEILVPRLDGLALCRTLKADPATRKIPVMIFSFLAAADRAREAGADHFLKKPLNETLLIQSVADLLPRGAGEGKADGAN